MLTSTITCIPAATMKAVPAKNIPKPRRCKGLKGIGEGNVFINTYERKVSSQWYITCIGTYAHSPHGITW